MPIFCNQKANAIEENLLYRLNLNMHRGWKNIIKYVGGSFPVHFLPYPMGKKKKDRRAY